MPDVHGRQWPNLPIEGRCPTCGQPDNCGDCTHQPLTDEEVRQLGGVPHPPIFVLLFENEDERDTCVVSVNMSLAGAQAAADKYHGAPVAWEFSSVTGELYAEVNGDTFTIADTVVEP